LAEEFWQTSNGGVSLTGSAMSMLRGRIPPPTSREATTSMTVRLSPQMKLLAMLAAN
jgi:hypothetical protein